MIEFRSLQRPGRWHPALFAAAQEQQHGDEPYDRLQAPNHMGSQGSPIPTRRGHLQRLVAFGT